MLDATLEQYPYFLQARVLRLMAQKQHNHQQYSAELKTVSAICLSSYPVFQPESGGREVVKLNRQHPIQPLLIAIRLLLWMRLKRWSKPTTTLLLLPMPLKSGREKREPIGIG